MIAFRIRTGLRSTWGRLGKAESWSDGGTNSMSWIGVGDWMLLDENGVMASYSWTQGETMSDRIGKAYSA